MKIVDVEQSLSDIKPGVVCDPFFGLMSAASWGSKGYTQKRNDPNMKILTLEELSQERNHPKADFDWGSWADLVQYLAENRIAEMAWANPVMAVAGVPVNGFYMWKRKKPSEDQPYPGTVTFSSDGLTGEALGLIRSPDLKKSAMGWHYRENLLTKEWELNGAMAAVLRTIIGSRVADLEIISISQPGNFHGWKCGKQVGIAWKQEAVKSGLNLSELRD